MRKKIFFYPMLVVILMAISIQATDHLRPVMEPYQLMGHIRVELVEFDGKPIEGYSFAESDPIIGDQYWTEITWNGKSKFPVKPGTPIWFRFRLNQAKIYGLEFE